MKIASANLQMTSSHASLQQHETKESLKMWVGQRRPDFAGEENRSRPSRGDTVSLSDAGKAVQTADSIKESQDAAVNNDPGLILIRSMLEFLTGRKIRIFDASELQSRPDQVATQSQTQIPATDSPQPSAGYGVEYDYHESYSETEQTHFAASGTVKTSDGREISFNLELLMARSYYEESNVNLRLGDATKKIDPLTLNFSGTAAQLNSQRFAFDLNADGQTENINFVAPGSGFLAFDRNNDGKINNGSELFGPTSGDGFAELAQLDSDHNGWIDENDPAFKQLQVWSKDANGQDNHQSLSAAGVGAISLSHISTPFDLKTSDNQTLGKIINSGIFLHEHGETGTIQQIDLTA